MGEVHIPARPVVPTILRDRDREAVEALRTVDSVLAAALRGAGGLADVDSYPDRAAAITAALRGAFRPETPAERQARETYNREVDSYNRAIRDRRQRRINDRQVAATRAKACPVCTSTHPGEC